MSTTSNTTFISNSENSTYEIGQRLGKHLQPSLIIGLNGTLGSGKTRLTQGLVSSIIEGNPVVVSPTYTLCIPYSGHLDLLHLDAYRIVDDDEVYDLGLDEAVDDGKVLVIEWVDKIAHLLPKVDLLIEFEHVDECVRKLSFSGKTEPGKQLVQDLFDNR